MKQKETEKPATTAEATKWAKDACDRIFSHYSEADMENIRLRNSKVVERITGGGNS